MPARRPNVFLAHAQIAQEDDIREASPQIIVKIARNASSFTIQCGLLLQNAHPQLQTPKRYVPSRGDHERCEHSKNGQPKPPLLPHEGRDSEPERCPLLIPNAIAVAGPNA